ncbi:hypothetical protein [Bifidobacterium pseudolongum]|uniref:hypothetical protein n=1 Tax=Bifidobacterium pseudolongum TaxID=1694 RepID=UPI0010205D43|nr:hypothetical protein [Bifidobacterium pseudolongum]RYQ43667.1 internalin [Bifidobacterium pseudolongum subsp. globosum]
MRRIQRNVAVVVVLAVLGTGVPAAHAQEAPTLDRPLAATLSAPAPAPAADESRAVGGTTSVSLGEGGATVFTRDTVDHVLLQCLFSRLISIFPQCGRMVFPGLVIMQSVM